MLGIPHIKEKNKEKDTFQKQSAMLEEVVKLPLALVWHGPLKLYMAEHFPGTDDIHMIDVGRDKCYVYHDK